MMNAILARLVNLCIAKGVIAPEAAETYHYGFDLLVFSLMNMALLLCMGFIVGRAGVVALILLCYIPLQSLGGGYHANTHLWCSFIMFIEMSIALFLVENVSAGILAIGAGISMLIICLLAPVQHPNASFGKSFARKMKWFVRIFSAIIWLTMILNIQAYPVLSSCISMSLILSGVSLCAATVKSKHILR